MNNEEITNITAEETTVAAPAPEKKSRAKKPAKKAEHAVTEKADDLVPVTAEVPADEKPETKKKEKKAKEEKAAVVRVSMLDRRQALMNTFAMTDRFCFENAEVAVRKDDYAMLTQNNAIMIYLKGEGETQAAKRICEVWLHNRRYNDVYISKNLFAQLCERSQEMNAYQQCINPKAKTSKMGLAIVDDEAVTKIINLLLSLL